MTYKITWITRNMVQKKELVNCKQNENYFTFYSAIYKAIEDGTFCINLGYGVHHFKAEVVPEFEWPQ